MTEQLSDYENALAKFIESQARFQQQKEQAAQFKKKLQADLTELDEKTKFHRQTLEEEAWILISLRHKIVYNIMEQSGLGICSAEIITDEFPRDQIHQTLSSPEERLGLFPLDQLRYLYFRAPGITGFGQHYENNDYFIRKYILLLCPHHWPQKLRYGQMPYLPRHIAEVHMTELVRTNNGFVTKAVGGKLIEGPFYIAPLPEKVFAFFQIPPLPSDDSH